MGAGHAQDAYAGMADVAEDARALDLEVREPRYRPAQHVVIDRVGVAIVDTVRRQVHRAARARGERAEHVAQPDRVAADRDRA